MVSLTIPNSVWTAQTDRLPAPGRDDSLALFFWLGGRQDVSAAASPSQGAPTVPSMKDRDSQRHVAHRKEVSARFLLRCCRSLRGAEETRLSAALDHNVTERPRRSGHRTA